MKLSRLGICGIINFLSYAAMVLFSPLAYPVGTAFLPRTVLGLFERLGTFSAVVFNMVLGLYLLKGTFEEEQ